MTGDAAILVFDRDGWHLDMADPTLLARIAACDREAEWPGDIIARRARRADVADILDAERFGSLHLDVGGYADTLPEIARRRRELLAAADENSACGNLTRPGFHTGSLTSTTGEVA